MKKNILLIFYIVFFFSLTNNLYSKVETSIIVKIDRKIITNFDVKNKILSTLIIAGDEISQENINKLKSQTLDSLIFLKLKEIELEKFNLKISDQRLNESVNRITRNNKQKLKSDFKNYGLDYNLWMKEIETELKWQQFIYSKYSKKIEIDDSTINEEMKKIIQSNSNEEEVNLSEIEVFQSEKVSNESLISKINKEIELNGFETTAMNYSISGSASEKGSLGWINLSILSKKINDTLKDLKPGQIGKPIIQTNSILFLKLNSIRNSKKNIDKEVLKKNLVSRKQNELFNLYSRSHLSKLKNNSVIQYQ